MDKDLAKREYRKEFVRKRKENYHEWIAKNGKITKNNINDFKKFMKSQE